MELMQWKFPTLHGFADEVYTFESRDRLVRPGGRLLVHKWDGNTPIVGNGKHRGVRYNAPEVREVFPVKLPVAEATGHGPESVWDTQVGGTHYTDMKIQPFQFSMANKLDPMQHTIVKYVSRFRAKNGIQDLEKAKQTIDLLIQWEKDNAI